MTKTLFELIEIPSISGNESAVLQYVSSRLSHLDLEVVEHDRFVAARLRGASSDRAFVLNGHVDTVGVADGWDTDPWQPVERDGKVFGLGACDMKAGVSIILDLLDDWAADVPTCDVIVVFVGDEETSGAGTKAFIEADPFDIASYKSIVGLILEPSDGLVAIGSRGNAFVNFTIDGVGGHAGFGHPKDQQTVTNMQRLLVELVEVETRWAIKFQNVELGSPSVTVTAISAGQDTPANQLPTTGLITCDIRITPQLWPELMPELQAIATSCGVTFEISQDGAQPPIVCDRDSWLPRWFEESGWTLTSYPCATDQPFMVAAGIPTVIFGPGSLAQAHGPNEFVSLSDIDSVKATISRLVQNVGW